MGFWNVGGLIKKQHNKILDPPFLKEIENLDLVFLAETHLGYNSNISKIGQFHCHLTCRPVTNYNNRHFGGLAVLCKPSLKSYVKILKTTIPDIQWIKLEKEFFGFIKDLFICIVYNPPEGSSYSKNLDYDILDCLEKDIVSYQKQGNILLCGDFNARVATYPDFIIHDDNYFTPLYQSYRSDKQILKRNSKDEKIDKRGRDLLDLCISNQIRIMNGRVLGDTFGKFTCYTPNGASTVDYVLLSESVLDQILYMKVSNFLPTLSDCHCMLEWSLCAKYCTEPNNSDVCTHEMSPGFIWSDDSRELFKKALESDEIQHRLNTFLNTDSSDPGFSIDAASLELADIIHSAAIKSLKRKKRPKYCGKNNRNKKWFDIDLFRMRKRLINYGKIYSKYPNDPAVKGHYYKILRQYSKARKNKYREYKQSLLKQIESLYDDNPKKYWQLIDELHEKDNTCNEHSSNISPSAWVNHFENLNELKAEFVEQIKNLENKLNCSEKEKCFTELDIKISETEISNAISSIKPNKAAGLDNITNNMLKSGQFLLLPSLHKMFNFCLTYGEYPESWAKGYLIPLFKANDRSDPNNYRGITITASLGKLFNKILDTRLQKFLDKNHIIDDSQIGFTKKARTSDHMFILKTIIDKYCNKKEGRVFACFVDFNKAFDTVIHQGIKLKLVNMGISSNFYNVIKSMYNLSKSCVRIGKSVTDFFHINVGVKQGDNLSPNLFKIFINDLPGSLKNTPDPVMVKSHPIHCLMYADDIVLLSTSANGLQKKLDQLNYYCKEWCLKINPTKTKVLVFNKAGRHIKHDFTFNNSSIKCAQHCKYLGINFSASGSFSVAQGELYNKGLKAYYKLRKDFLSLNPSIINSLHVFDHTIKPILLYSSEIWGYFNPFKKKLISDRPPIDEGFHNLKSEKLHLKFCKFLLGVSKKATNLATLSELGRFPLHFDIIKSMIRYWYRLENLGSSFPLLQYAYLESKSLHESKIPSWYGCITVLGKAITGMNQLSTLSNFKFKTMYKKLVLVYFEKCWQQQMSKNKDGKLANYVKFKCHFGLEKYLSILRSPEHRKNFARLRISAHRLRIEQGRYQGTPRQNRICLRCNSPEVDDEKHFLFSCKSCVLKRNAMDNAINCICPNFRLLSQNDKLIWLLNVENIDILVSICELIKESDI